MEVKVKNPKCASGHSRFRAISAAMIADNPLTKDTDKIEIVTGTVWQVPPHAGKQAKAFGDVGEHHDC